jgi:hypothetical protein
MSSEKLLEHCKSRVDAHMPNWKLPVRNAININMFITPRHWLPTYPIHILFLNVHFFTSYLCLSLPSGSFSFRVSDQNSLYICHCLRACYKYCQSHLFILVSTNYEAPYCTSFQIHNVIRRPQSVFGVLTVKLANESRPSLGLRKTLFSVKSSCKWHFDASIRARILQFVKSWN